MNIGEKGTELIGPNTQAGLGKSLRHDGSLAGMPGSCQRQRLLTYRPASGSARASSPRWAFSRLRLPDDRKVNPQVTKGNWT
jgi:hypothetical protein